VTRFWPNVTQFSQPINKPTTIFTSFTSKSSQTLPNFSQNPNLRKSNPFSPNIFIFSSSNHQTNSINLHHHQHSTLNHHHYHLHHKPTPSSTFPQTLTMVETRNKRQTTKKAKTVPKCKPPVKPNPNAAPTFLQRSGQRLFQRHQALPSDPRVGLQLSQTHSQPRVQSGIHS